MGASMDGMTMEPHALIDGIDRALVVIAHPDDAEFGAAATIARLIAAGTRVDYVVTTDGGKGTEDPAVTPEMLSSVRVAEQRAAADILGVTEIVHLGHPDGYLEPTLAVRRDITRQIRRHRPDVVITWSPQRRLDGNPYIGHPDHLATGEATLAAVYPAARDRLNFPELANEEGLEPWKVRQVLLMGVEQANLHVDISETFDIGMRALLAHASQVSGRDDLEERVRERARQAGEPHGMALAQPFLSVVLT